VGAVRVRPRRRAQREAITLAIGPIWEANHVWLVFAIVLTFVAFPRAFALISTALHVPLLLLLLGVVLRGVSFVFRAYDQRDDAVQARWSAVFAASSVFCPVVLGIVVGNIASGTVRVGTLDLVAPWTRAFPYAIGLLTLGIVSFLAAVYLTLDTRDDPALQEDFRRRGLAAAAVVFVLAWVSFFLARTGAPEVWHGLWASRWALPFQVGVAGCGLACVASLWSRRFVLARDLAAVQVALVVGGWAASQYPVRRATGSDRRRRGPARGVVAAPRRARRRRRSARGGVRVAHAHLQGVGDRDVRSPVGGRLWLPRAVAQLTDRADRVPDARRRAPRRGVVRSGRGVSRGRAGAPGVAVRPRARSAGGGRPSPRWRPRGTRRGPLRTVELGGHPVVMGLLRDRPDVSVSLVLDTSGATLEQVNLNLRPTRRSPRWANAGVLLR
jgi:cytochrome d ubiquinol oxidase subunit II